MESATAAALEVWAFKIAPVDCEVSFTAGEGVSSTFFTVSASQTHLHRLLDPSERSSLGG